MTATLPEADRADPGEAGPEAHLKALADAMAEVDRCTRQVIVDELAELWPALDREEERAAGCLRAAVEALEAPEAAIAGLDEEIACAEAELSSWGSQLETGDVAARVTARTWIAEWEAEVSSLRGKRDFAQAELLPLAAARNKARDGLELATGAKRGLAWAMVDPFGTAVGQGTRAYISHRQLRLNHVLLMSDPGYPEWDCAVAELRELCIAAMRGGHDVAADLPGMAEVMFRAMTSAMADAMSTPPDPAPAPAEIMKQTEVDFGNMALEQSAARNVIDDRRGARPQPAPPPRSYMQVPYREVR